MGSRNQAQIEEREDHNLARARAFINFLRSFLHFTRPGIRPFRQAIVRVLREEQVGFLGEEEARTIFLYCAQF